jgi:hypothetical protein
VHCIVLRSRGQRKRHAESLERIAQLLCLRGIGKINFARQAETGRCVSVARHRPLDLAAKLVREAVPEESAATSLATSAKVPLEGTEIGSRCTERKSSWRAPTLRRSTYGDIALRKSPSRGTSQGRSGSVANTRIQPTPRKSRASSEARRTISPLRQLRRRRRRRARREFSGGSRHPIPPRNGPDEGTQATQKARLTGRPRLRCIVGLLNAAWLLRPRRLENDRDGRSMISSLMDTRSRRTSLRSRD